MMNEIQTGDKLIRTYKSNGFFTQDCEYEIHSMDGLRVIIKGDNGELNEYELIDLKKYFKKKPEVTEMGKVKEFTILEIISVEKYEWDKVFKTESNWYEVLMKVKVKNGGTKVIEKLFTCCQWDRIKKMGAFYGV